MPNVTQIHGRVGLLSLLPLLAVALAACGKGNQQPQGTGTTAMPAAAEAPAPRLSTAQIGEVLSASDSAEILPSELALQKSKTPEVKAYAQRMIKDHGMLEDSLRALEARQNITPAPSALSQQISSATQTTMQELKGLSGAAFDKAYVLAMLDSHQLALSTIDEQLIPAAQDPAVRAALEQKVRPIVEAHLKAIEEVERSLGYR